MNLLFFFSLLSEPFGFLGGRDFTCKPAQRGKDGKASKRPGNFTEYPTRRGTRRGLKGHLRFAEGCRANPRAVSIVVLDAGRPLYLCMGKSNRRGGNVGRDQGKNGITGIKEEEARLYIEVGTTAKKENLPVRAIDKESPLNLLTVQGASRARQSGIFGTRVGLQGGF